MNTQRLKSVLVWISGGALLAAMLVDTLAMIGRQIGLPLIGAIEIVQVSVLFAGCGALVAATLDRSHARVNLLLDRAPERVRLWLERMHALAAAALYVALFAGSVWISKDLWNGHEESELLRIPYLPLRVAVVVTLLTLLVIVLSRLRHRESR